jgi:uncharacterized protein with PIN domain
MDGPEPARLACDAMCGGLARWLRALGHDTFYREGIDDAELVRIAGEQGRVLISSDGKLFERNALVRGEVRSLFLPRGLKLLDQVDHVVRELDLPVLDPRCTQCNGRFRRVRREEVGGEVPARSLVWATEFYRCEACGRVFWNGTHWQRIERVRRKYAGG